MKQLHDESASQEATAACIQAYLAINEGDSGLQLYVNFELFWIIKFWITKKTHHCI